MKCPVLFQAKPREQEHEKKVWLSGNNKEKHYIVTESELKNIAAVQVGSIITKSIDQTIMRSLDKSISKYLRKAYVRIR